MDWAEVMQTLRSLWIVWLMVLVGLVFWWAYRPKNKKRFERDAQIPFEDES